MQKSLLVLSALFLAIYFSSTAQAQKKAEWPQAKPLSKEQQQSFDAKFTTVEGTLATYTDAQHLKNPELDIFTGIRSLSAYGVIADTGTADYIKEK